MLTQDYAAYTAADQETWAILYKRQVRAVQQHAYEPFWDALRVLDFDGGKIPVFGHLNKRLDTLTGWSIYVVPGLVDNNYFYGQMYHKKFGASTWLRKREQLDYLEEPDMFHDIFGHVPLLADPVICAFMASIADMARRARYNEDIVEALARLYWYTVEFGLIKEKGQTKIYGAGILSSIGETEYCMSGQVKLLPFDLETIIATPYIKETFQSQYFVLENIGQLQESIIKLEHLLKPSLAVC